jgi:dephospho-CoA kinase
MIIGIAGKTGAGKNYVAGLLEQRGWRTLDLDSTAHRALDALSDVIEEKLGPGLLRHGSIDRAELGRRVFADKALLEELEKITYPWIEEEARRWLSEYPEIPAALHAVNLHKTSLTGDCNAVIWVKAPFLRRRRRVISRDNRPWKELRGRFRSQNRLNPKLFSSDAEIYSVRNSGNDASLNASLDRILRRLEGPGGKNER